MENNTKNKETCISYFTGKKIRRWLSYTRWEIREIILKKLRKRRYGLTITDLSKDMNLCRKVVREEVKKLEEKNKVYIRKIGQAKLCYAPRHYKEKGRANMSTYIKNVS